ncbi:preprotein translocase subunit SecG [Algivirga pacifica]|uniref:Protein-export membrane protein SecG n=1 Tax=Algivirga pacifica TaxID=1162670 RepID=A0ABP9D1M7_9BACT
MTNFLIIFILVVAVLLILLILAQDSKGGGLTGAASSANQVMGARRSTDWIEKATWWLAVIMLGLSIGVNSFSVDSDVVPAQRIIGAGEQTETLSIEPEATPVETETETPADAE